MRTVVMTMGLLTVASLCYEFTVEKLAVGGTLTLLLPLALTAYGKKVTAKLDADKKAALEAIALREDLERQLADLKRDSPWTKSSRSNRPTGGRR